MTFSEVWVPAYGLPGYEVSDLGGFRNARGLLKAKKNRRGDWTVAAKVDGKWVGRVLAKVVLQSFVRPFKKNEMSLHGQGGRDDNSLSNLSIGTAKKNAADRDRDGTTARGIRQGLCKLSREDVIKIRHSSEHRDILAEEFGVCWTTIYNIQNNITHKETF